MEKCLINSFIYFSYQSSEAVMRLWLLARMNSCIVLRCSQAENSLQLNRGWAVLSSMFIKLCSILLFTTSSRGCRAVLSNRASSLHQFVHFFLIIGSDAAGPTDGCKAYCTLHHRHVEICNISVQKFEGPKFL